MPGALSGVTVIDFTRVLSGPYCTMVLADHGARVIKIEHPVRGDDTRHWGPPFIGDGERLFPQHQPQQGERHARLQAARRAGRFSSSCSPPPTSSSRTSARARSTRSGWGPSDVLARHPRLVYCSISGYGQTGPRREEPGYDAVMQAEGGLMSITGDADGPPYRLGVAITDIVSGLFAAQGVMAALIAREADRARPARRHRHARCDGRAADLSGGQLLRDRPGAGPAGQSSSDDCARTSRSTPRTATSSSPGATTRSGGGSVRSSAGRSWPTTRAFAPTGTASHTTKLLRPELERALTTRTRSEWVRELNAAGVPCGSVREIGEVLADPQLAARGMIAEVQHSTIGTARVISSPVKLSDTPPSVRTAPPTLGQHTTAVLTSWVRSTGDRRLAKRRRDPDRALRAES